MTDETKANLQLKITDYFSHHSTLKKEHLSEFLHSIDLSIWDTQDEKEALWYALSKNSKTSDNLLRDLVKKNLLAFIDSNEVYNPDQLLEETVKKYLSKSVLPSHDEASIKSSSSLEDYNYEHLVQLKKLLSLVSFNDRHSILRSELDSLLHKNNHIAMDKESFKEILSLILPSNSIEITFEQYTQVVDTVNQAIEKILRQSQSNPVKKLAKMFSGNSSVLEYVYDEKASFDFSHLLEYITVIFQQFENLNSIHKEICNAYEEKETNETKTQLEFNKKYYTVIQGNISTYLNEMDKSAKEQSGKMVNYKETMNTEIKALQKENQSLEDKLAQNKTNQSSDIAEISKEMIEKLENQLNDITKMNEKIKKENIEMQKDLSNKDTIITSQINKLEFADQQVSALKSKIIVLQKENEALNKSYSNLLNDINKELFKGKIPERPIMEEGDKDETEKIGLNEETKNLVSMHHEQLIAYIVEKENYSHKMEESIGQLNKEISELEAAKKNTEAKLIDQINELSILKSDNIQLRNDNDALTYEIEALKPKQTTTLLSILNDDHDNKTIQKSSFGVIKIAKESAFTFLNSHQPKIIMPINKRQRNFDFLFQCMEQKIIVNLDDIYYNSHSNVIFTEKIMYLTVEKKMVKLLLFITTDYFYLFDFNTYEKYISFPLIELYSINISTNNNFISLTFLGDIIIFETFRVLELIHFFKLIRKDTYKYSMNINNFNNQFLPKNNKKNYTNSPYFGNALLSGYLMKKYDGFIIGFNEKFVVLSDIGMIILDEPYGKPTTIINLLFSHMHEYDDVIRNLFCFVITIGKNEKLVFGTHTDEQRKLWMDEIKKWILLTTSSYNNNKIE